MRHPFASRLNLGAYPGTTLRHGKIGLEQLTLCEIRKEAASVQSVAISQYFQRGSLGQGSGIHLDDMGTRRESIKAVFAILVGHGIGTVLQIDANTRNAKIPRLLHTCPTAVTINLANDIGLVREHASQHLHRHTGAIGAHHARPCLGCIGAISLLCSHPHAHAIGQYRLSSHGYAADGKLQGGSRASCGIGQVPPVETCRSLHIGKPHRQLILQHHIRQGHACPIVELDGVIDEISYLCRRFAGRLLDHHAPGRSGIERNVKMHGPRSRCKHKTAAIGSSAIHLPVRRLQSHGQSGWKHMPRRREHHDPVCAGRHIQKLIAPIHSRDHRTRG